MKKRIIVLGCTGSIGKSTFDVVAGFRDDFEIAGLSSHTNEASLLELAERFGVAALALSGKTSSDPRIRYSGTEGLLEMIGETEADYVVNGISGAAGFHPSVRALEAGKRLALANKETLVMAGGLVMGIAEKKGLPILPVDSEHSAVFLMYNRFGRGHISGIVLTASGGAFRDLPKERLDSVTPEDALKHPTWSMGKKITIDSASLANKGLEVIEAHHLFSLDAEQIKVLVHPQSYVHSFIETKDGALYAQIGKPDMKLPILNALTYPETVSYPPGKFSLAGMSLSFSEPDSAKFPMLSLAYEALEQGGAAPLAYNASNEIAVEAFCAGEIAFTGIPELVERTLRSRDWSVRAGSVSDVLTLDEEARSLAAKIKTELLRSSTRC